jgi:hypothetical protein
MTDDRSQGAIRKVKAWLADDARQMRQAGPIGALELLKLQGGWSVMIRAYFKAAGAGDPSVEEVRELRTWAMGLVADHRDAVLV